MSELPKITKPFPRSAVWYHGSNTQFDRFRLPPRYSQSEQMGFGIHLARNKDFAALYGNIIYRCKVYPTKILNLFEPVKVGTTKDSMAKEFYKGSRYRPYIWDKEYYFMNPDVKSANRAEQIIRKYGYDTVYYEAKYGTRTLHGARYTNQTEAVIMLDPTKIEILNYNVTSTKNG